MNSLFASFILTFLLFQAIMCEWTPPVDVANHPDGWSLVSDVYHDDATDVTHFLYTMQYPKCGFMHMAVSENGTVLNRTMFIDTQSCANDGRIRGRGDGKTLHIAMIGSRLTPAGYSYNDVNLTESHDGGMTWSPITQIPKEDANDKVSRYLGDIVLVKENGRVFEFHYVNDNSLRIITKAPDSSVYSIEVPIIPKLSLYYNSRYMRAAYTYWLSRLMLHVVYAEYGSNCDIKYIRSTNNGISWTAPRTIVREDVFEMLSIDADSRLPSVLTFAYSRRNITGNFIIISKNYGDNFSLPIPATQGRQRSSINSTATIKICGTKGFPFLVSMFAVDPVNNGIGMEYAYWDFDNMTRYSAPNIFDNQVVTSVGFDCIDDDPVGQLNVTAFVGVKYNEVTHYQMSRDIVPIPEEIITKHQD